MSSVRLAIPIVAGKVEAWRRFCQELSGSRRRSYIGSRRRLGIIRERMELIETPFGAQSVNTLEASDIGRVFAQIATSEAPFDLWYRERLAELHGIVLGGSGPLEPSTAAGERREVAFEWVSDPTTFDEAHTPPHGETAA